MPTESSLATTTPTLTELRQRFARPLVAPSFDTNEPPLKTPLAGCSIRRGTVVAVSGSAKTSWVVQFLAQHPTLRVAWVEDELTIFPTALAQQQINLNNLLFCEAGGHIFWVVDQLLQSRLFEAVVMQGASRNNTLSRRLQLATEAARAVLLTLETSINPHWSLALAVEVQATGQGQLQQRILRQRF